MGSYELYVFLYNLKKTRAKLYFFVLEAKIFGKEFSRKINMQNAIYIVIETDRTNSKITYSNTIPTEKWEKVNCFIDSYKFGIKINDKRIYQYESITEFSISVRELFRSIFEGLRIFQEGCIDDDIFISISAMRMLYSREELLWHGNAKSYINGYQLDGAMIGSDLENEFYSFVVHWKDLYMKN